MKKIFIDGSAGTTGLRIAERLENRKDIELIKLSEENRKDITARKQAINLADIAFLCLPDAAAIEAVSLIENDNTVVLDTSTAHRTNDDWAYGFPELSKEFAEKIKNSKRIAVPGCHASGFIALVYPLVEKGLISKDVLLSAFSLTGYSGGGKKMIAEYEAEDKDTLLNAARQYGLSQSHKHIPEMMHLTGLLNAPVFCPIVASFYSGMLVTVPVFKSMLKEGCTAEDVKETLKSHYNGSLNIEYTEDMSDEGFADSNTLSGTDKMQISVSGNEERILLMARYDNLGKGASGAAAQCLDLVLEGFLK